MAGEVEKSRLAGAAGAAQASELAQSAFDRYKNFTANDSRMKFSHIPDAPRQGGGGGGFTVSDDEFIAGTPGQVAEMIIEQCRTTGAEHFLAVLHWGAALAEVRAAHELFGHKVIPVLKTSGTKTTQA